MDEYICKNELDKIDDYPPPFKKVLECTTTFDDVFVGHIIVDVITFDNSDEKYTKDDFVEVLIKASR